ncbi:MAG: hypothetical protein AAF307_10325 [Pseudomonadota bacterium]
MTDVSSERQKVIEDLLVLLRKFAGPNLLREIAEGDSQAMRGDEKKHMTALEELRDTYDWRLFRQPKNHWYPCEPIELIAYAVDHHSQPAQVFCNALLVVSELDGTEQDYMHYRWFETPGEQWFRNLNDPWRTPLIAAFAFHHANSSDLEREFWANPTAKGRWIEGFIG